MKIQHILQKDAVPPIGKKEPENVHYEITMDDGCKYLVMAGTHVAHVRRIMPYGQPSAVPEATEVVKLLVAALQHDGTTEALC